ncbi:unnamed protein product [Paramecium octaurelia]|uniref:Uncharacterized protein n=1 Tax=Paramecium octaurelia TaxID=43137 RepID=A0A8S1W2U8_PAROT|nr:unnamed protein product [Paramecium octaurelia]
MVMDKLSQMEIPNINQYKSYLQGSKLKMPVFHRQHNKLSTAKLATKVEHKILIYFSYQSNLLISQNYQ